MPQKLVSRRSSFRASQIRDQGPGWYVIQEDESSTESESASVHEAIREGNCLLRRMRRKRKLQEANADETKIDDVVRQTLSEMIETIGKFE